MSGPEEANGAVRYQIVESDLAEADREAAYQWLLFRQGADYADRWHQGLLTAIQQLAGFPGPSSHPAVRPASEQRPEIRRLLYYGPQGRRSRTSGLRYRVLFTVIAPPLLGGEAVIRILRILHGAQAESPEEEPGENEAVE